MVVHLASVPRVGDEYRWEVELPLDRVDRHWPLRVAAG